MLNQDENNYYRQLVKRYAENLASDKELEVFFNLLSQGKLDQYLTESMDASAAASEKPVAPVVTLTSTRYLRKKFIFSAAAVLILVFVGAYILFHTNKTTVSPGIAPSSPVVTTDLPAGRSKAVLVLANGKRVILDSAFNGQLTRQGSTVVYTKNGQLTYDAGSTTATGEPMFNTVSTAAGETYTLTLADGSQVYLNSASSIHFPVVFDGRQRKIGITGEVYIKVAKNPKQPFIVTAGNVEVLALGTEFNINSYENENALTTTLIEGSVRVSTGAGSPVITGNVLLKPGQQTQLPGNGRLSAAQYVNTDDVVAWKEGWFRFESADLKTILRQFARWYDVEVIYDGDIVNRKFFVVVKRSSSLMTVLEMLKDNNIDYRVEGKKLYVKTH